MARAILLPSQAPASDESARVITRAMLRAAEFWGVTQIELGEIVGLSGSSISRLRAGSMALSSGTKAFELAALFVRAWHAVNTLFASRDDRARAWLRRPNPG